MQAATRGELTRLRNLETVRRATRLDPSIDLSRYDWPRIARPNQLPPRVPFTYWCVIAGRGFGKTRLGSEWVRRQVRTHRFVNLIGATLDDARSIMIQGESGILECCPDHERPRFVRQDRTLRWPNGATSQVFTADEPERLRGKQHMKLWCDELASWRYSESWDQAIFGLRLGDNPQALVTTTPRPRKLISELLAHPGTITTRGTTYENRANLAPQFYASIIAKYEGTRLGRQELLGELLQVHQGAWFSSFDRSKAVSTSAEYVPGKPVFVSIDAGTSLHTGATIFQTTRVDQYRVRFDVVGEYLGVERFSEQNAVAIMETVNRLCPGAPIDQVWIDPASRQRTSVGPVSYGEYERIFGPRKLNHSPQALVVDGLDQIEVLLDHGDLVIHPRCEHLLTAFGSYVRAQIGGEWASVPAANQSPHEDMLDSLRYGVRAVMPEGRKPQPKFSRRPVRQVF